MSPVETQKCRHWGALEYGDHTASVGKTCTLRPLGTGVASFLHRMDLLCHCLSTIKQLLDRRDHFSGFSEKGLLVCTGSKRTSVFGPLQADVKAKHCARSRFIGFRQQPWQRRLFSQYGGLLADIPSGTPKIPDASSARVPRFAQSVVSGACGAICEILTVWCTISSIRASVLLSFTINPRALSRRF